MEIDIVFVFEVFIVGWNYCGSLGKEVGKGRMR